MSENDAKAGVPTAAPAATAGQWNIVPSPNASSEGNLLRGVTCVSADDCWAVGSYFNPTLGFIQTLIQHWDGSAWTIVNSPNPLSNDNQLTSVTCVSANDCWAIGWYYNHTVADYQTLIEHWDGSAWSIVSSPNPLVGQSGDSFLNSVTCASATDCWAVGGFLVGVTGQMNFQTLIEHWDGSGWSVVTGPVPASNARLFGVTCLSGSDCTAVGTYGVTSTDSVSETLIEHNTGSGWATVSSPNTGALQDDILYGVTCVSGNDCWAVGYYSNRTAFQTLIQRWDGSGWAIVTSPSTSASRSNVLNSVSCSASDCWAVGYYQTNTFVSQTLIEHNNGSGWAIVPSPSTSADQHNNLHSVTCVSASDCWAVGRYGSSPNPQTYQTLIQHYTVPPVGLSSAVSRKTHGSAETFDIILPLTGTPGIECRSGGANGDHTLVFSFANPLNTVGGASVTSGTGSVSSGAIDSSDPRNYVVNLTGVTNAQIITVSLANVSDSAGNSSPAVAGSMGVLLGDTSADGVVNSADITQTRRQSGEAATAGPPANFRTDLSIDGVINSADITLVRRQSGNALP